MVVANYFVRFMLFSFLGWIYECTYCTIKTRHWDNRGFLFGPICPIYGIGATAAMLAFFNLPAFDGGDTPWWKIFLICAIGSAILEYSVSYILEKKYHAMWWDYSNVPLNLNGRICLPATLGFGVAGIVIIKWFFPWLLPYFQVAAGHPIITEIVSLVLMMLLGMDIALTAASLTELLATLDEMQDKFDERMELSVEKMASAPGAIRVKMSEAPVAIKEKVSGVPSAIKGGAVSVARLTRHQRRHLHSIATFKKIGHAKVVEHWKKTSRDLR